MKNITSLKITVTFSALLLLLLVPALVAAQTDREADLKAINQLLEQYRATEDVGDMSGQAKLMAPDRVWVSQFASGRRVDNLENMRIQQAQAEQRKKAVPGLQQFSEDREKLIKFYGEGTVAVVSFYRYATRVFPPGTSEDAKREYAAGSELMSLVLEKRAGEWMIVHTHVSGIGPCK